MIPAARYLLPVYRLFPIWRFGPRRDLIDGSYIDDGWMPDWYETREISREQAEQIERAEDPQEEARRIVGAA